MGTGGGNKPGWADGFADGEVRFIRLEYNGPDWDDGMDNTSRADQNFLDCVRTRKLPFRDIEIAHRATTVCHLGNIAYWLNRPLKWDPVKEEIVGDAEANRWINRPMRAPWTL